jgi:hypothetical protein
MIYISTPSGAKQLLPIQWVKHTEPLTKLPILGLRQKQKMKQILLESVLVKTIDRIKPGLLKSDLGKAKSAKALDSAEITPITVAITVSFVLTVFYFITEQYFTLSEYYVDGFPVVLIIAMSLGALIFCYVLIKKLEPKRKDSHVYALLFAIGIGFFLYPFLIRMNIWSDTQGITSYTYELGSDYVWRSENPKLPELEIYLQQSRWWQQFKPGDFYEFDLRYGGLGNWLVNMDKIYTEQQVFYDCHGALECMANK